MSSIDLSNPKVLGNFIKGLMREGHGEFLHLENVVVFKDANNNQYVVPQEILNEVDVVKVDSTGEEKVIIPAPDTEPEVIGSGEVVKKKKGKLKVS